jgi:hypothetical protein
MPYCVNGVTMRFMADGAARHAAVQSQLRFPARSAALLGQFPDRIGYQARVACIAVASGVACVLVFQLKLPR